MHDVAKILQIFRERTLKLVERLKEQVFKLENDQTFTKFARKYPHLLKKYREFIDLNILLRSGDGKKLLPTALKVYF